MTDDIVLDVGNFAPAPEGPSDSPETPAPSPDWRSGLSEDLAGDASLADIKDLNGLVKSYIHAQKMVGKDKITIPGEDATPDDLDNFFNKLGRPAAPGEYAIDQPEEIPEGFAYNKEHEEKMREVFHKAGLTNKQASDIWKTMQDEAIGGFNGYVENVTQRLTKEHEELRKEWGVKYNENAKLADWVAREFGGEEFIKFLNESKVGREPKFLKVAAAIGAKLGEDVQQNTGKASNLMTPAEARSKIASIQADKSHPYNDWESAAHKQAVDDMSALYMMAYPEEKDA